MTCRSASRRNRSCSISRSNLPRRATKPRTQASPGPDDRKVVDLGVLTLDKPVADTLEAQKKLLFLPNRLTDGIELSDDRLPVIRSEVYALAFARRGS